MYERPYLADSLVDARSVVHQSEGIRRAVLPSTTATKLELLEEFFVESVMAAKARLRQLQSATEEVKRTGGSGCMTCSDTSACTAHQEQSTCIPRGKQTKRSVLNETRKPLLQGGRELFDGKGVERSQEEMKDMFKPGPLVYIPYVKKQDNGKTHWELVPMKALSGIADVLAEAIKVDPTTGEQKYTEHTWQTVEPKRYFAALLRHLQDLQDGIMFVEDTPNIRTIDAIQANAMFLSWFMLNGIDLDLGVHNV